jgi:hypothetical protein
MIAKTYTCPILGIDAIIWSVNLSALVRSPVEVKVDPASGLPGFAIVRYCLTQLGT